MSATSSALRLELKEAGDLDTVARLGFGRRKSTDTEEFYEHNNTIGLLCDGTGDGHGT